MPCDDTHNRNPRRLLMKVAEKITILAVIAFIFIAGALSFVACSKNADQTNSQNAEQTNGQSVETTNEKQIQKDIEDVESPVARIEGD